MLPQGNGQPNGQGGPGQAGAYAPLPPETYSMGRHSPPQGHALSGQGVSSGMPAAAQMAQPMGWPGMQMYPSAGMHMSGNPVQQQHHQQQQQLQQMQQQAMQQAVYQQQFMQPSLGGQITPLPTNLQYQPQYAPAQTDQVNPPPPSPLPARFTLRPSPSPPALDTFMECSY